MNLRQRFYLKLGKSKLQKLYCQTRSSTNIFVNFTLTASGWQPTSIVQHISQNSSSKKKTNCFLKSLQLANHLTLLRPLRFVSNLLINILSLSILKKPFLVNNCILKYVVKYLLCNITHNLTVNKNKPNWPVPVVTRWCS